MIWDDDTHAFSSTTCLHTGAPCPAAVRMAERLVSALRLSDPFTGDDFEITGSAQLTGCKRSCAALYVAGKSAVRIYCDVAEDADTGALDRFATAFFGPGTAGAALCCTGLEQIPCAMVLALPHGGQPAAAQMAGA